MFDYDKKNIFRFCFSIDFNCVHQLLTMEYWKWLNSFEIKHNIRAHTHIRNEIIKKKKDEESLNNTTEQTNSMKLIDAHACLSFRN